MTWDKERGLYTYKLREQQSFFEAVMLLTFLFVCLFGVCFVAADATILSSSSCCTIK